jgi:hypothetical protein
LIFSATNFFIHRLYEQQAELMSALVMKQPLFPTFSKQNPWTLYNQRKAHKHQETTLLSRKDPKRFHGL